MNPQPFQDPCMYLEVRVDAEQVVLLEFEPNVLGDEVDGHDVVGGLPGDDDVSMAAGGSDISVKGGLHKARVLLDNPCGGADAVKL